MSAIIKMKKLTLRLGEFVLGPVSLQLGQGDYLVLLGPSGCGKTSLLNSIAGVYPVSQGMLALEGADSSRTPPHRRGIGYVSQTPNLFPHLNVRDNIRFGLAYLDLPEGEIEAQFDRIVALLGVGHLLAQSVSTLSGGEARRVALARSMVIRPRLLLLDEPLSMLDPNARVQMLDTLFMLHQETGTTTIHVTHDREEAWAMDEQCAVMLRGRIVQQGSVEELFRNPNSSTVALFLGGTNVFPATFRTESGQTMAELGWMQAELSDPFAEEEGYVLIRPEAIVFAKSQGEADFIGKVKRVSGRGAFSIVEVEVATGINVTIHMPYEQAFRIIPGDQLPLRLSLPLHAIKE
ncbi:MAG: ABC transporter ATP-binding protein [Planctomycetes bacterium]|nr:ABC transporter ATP-binding protein [Planctomycetota bacterium]